MVDEPFYRMPDEVVVPLEEVRSVVRALDGLVDRLRERGAADDATLVDAIVDRIASWVWDLLRDLDTEGGQ